MFVSSTGISHAIDNAFDNKFVVDADDDDDGAGAGAGEGAGVEIFVMFIMIKLSILQSIPPNMFDQLNTIIIIFDQCVFLYISNICPQINDIKYIK